MNHCDYQNLLSQYMDEQLDAQTTYSLEQHLPLCPQCRRELEQLTTLRQMCLSLPEVDIPAGLHERIMAKADSAGVKKGLGWVRRAVIPLAAAVLIFLLGRGLPDLSNYKSSTMQESSGARNMLMAVPQESSNEAPEEDISAEDMKLADSAEEPSTAGADESELGVAEDSAGSIRAAGETETAVESIEDSSYAPNEATENGIKAEKADGKIKGRFERPSYLKYGFIIALIVGLGVAMIRMMTRKK